MKRCRSPRARGIALIECLVYIAVFFVVISLAFAAFYEVLQNSTRLTRNADDIVRTLKAGERWRADVRNATKPPVLVNEGGTVVLRIARAKGNVDYVFKDATVWRRTRLDAAWQEFLTEVKSSRMLDDRRQHVSAWRWELELASAQKSARVVPLFTFVAAPAAKGQP